MQKKILIVDDDVSIVNLVSMILEKNNYLVIRASDGDEALEKVEKYDIDAAILDLMLPDINGLSLLQQIRNNPRVAHIPILMLTSKTEEIDTVLGLEMGADDYIHKPFKKRELVARLNVVFRRIEQDQKIKNKPVLFGDVEMDLISHSVQKSGKDIVMSPKEFQLLAMLASNPGRVYTRDEILDRVWDEEVALETRTVDVHIRRIRKKIEDDPQNPMWIETVRGYGYRLTK